VRVLTGLPSTARRNGSLAVGPSDVSFQGSGGMYVAVGLGITARAQLPVAGQEAAGWVLRGRPSQDTWSQVANILAYEVRTIRTAPERRPTSTQWR
jgi:hypothetical protein